MKSRGFAVAIALYAASIARADEMTPEARRHFARGVQLYDHGQFEKAIQELELVDAIEHRPEVLYALGQAARKQRSFSRALDYYERALAIAEGAETQKTIRVQIKRCEAELRPAERAARAARAREKAEALQRERAAAVESARAEEERARLEKAEQARVEKARKAADEARAERDRAERARAEAAHAEAARAEGAQTRRQSLAPAEPATARPWHRDLAGGLLLGVGLASIATGGVLLGLGNAAVSSQNHSLHDYLNAREKDAFRPAGGALLGVGGALVVGAIIRYVVVARRGRASRLATRFD